MDEKAWWAMRVDHGLVYAVYKKKPRIEKGRLVNSDRWFESNYVMDIPAETMSQYGCECLPGETIPIRPLNIEKIVEGK